LGNWKKDHPYQANLRHGAHSRTVRQKYSDLRTTEGQKLKAVIDSLVSDLGGPAQLNAAQNAILGALRSKFIVVFQISDYLDRQTDIIDSDGQLLACLGRNFLSYTESIRRDLEVLFGVKRRRAKQSYEKALKALSGGKT
jgi:hypothetical protein